MGWNMVSEGVVEHDGVVSIGEGYRLKSRDQWVNPIGESLVPAMRMVRIADIEPGYGIRVLWREGMREETTSTTWVNPENISLEI
jgi:hypothetical protein